MKFARQFQDHLTNDGYPASWVDNAISYGQLKKCLKRVERELSSLGLDVATLRTLLTSVEASNQQQSQSQVRYNEQRRSSVESEETPFQYTFSPPSSPSKNVIPKLLFVVDAKTGEPISAALSPETRNFLHQLALTEKLTSVRITPLPEESTTDTEDNGESDREVRYIQIPLTADGEFFGMLERKLTGLAQLQKDERHKLTSDIQAVGQAVSRTTNPDEKSGRKDLARWRSLLECYIDAEVFFTTHEQDHGIKASKEATSRYSEFLKNANTAGLLDNSKYKSHQGRTAVKQFLAINEELLQCLRFQEINRVAMYKILKKFDKRTALDATNNFSVVLPDTLISTDFSKALVAQVATDIISVIPQLGDFQCPICFNIAYRPVRLRCGHLFCIRCIVVLQRQQRNMCALCREPVVMEADSTNIDPGMVDFMKRYFPEEVKAKQREVGDTIAKETYGDHKCCIM